MLLKKIEAACLARCDDALVIVARTDALAIEGIQGTLKRARAYAEAGADMIFPDAVRSEEYIAAVVEAAGETSAGRSCEAFRFVDLKGLAAEFELLDAGSRLLGREAELIPWARREATSERRVRF